MRLFDLVLFLFNDATFHVHGKCWYGVVNVLGDRFQYEPRLLFIGFEHTYKVRNSKHTCQQNCKYLYNTKRNDGHLGSCECVKDGRFVQLITVEQTGIHGVVRVKHFIPHIHNTLFLSWVKHVVGFDSFRVV